MNPTVELILTILQVLVCVVITVLILLQNGKSEGLGSMSGAAETFFGKNKGRSVEAKLQKVTVILAVAFILLTAVLAIF